MRRRHLAADVVTVVAIVGFALLVVLGLGCAVARPVPPTCAESAAAWCERRGWVLAEAGDGRAICTAPGIGIGDDCAGCSTYAVLVWRDGAPPAFCRTTRYSTRAGAIYAGHATCQCANDLIPCGAWTPGDCIDE